jgi:NTE family protein
MEVKKKVGVAFGGGAVLGAAHIGVLKAFHKAGVPIDMVSGTSAGAIIAACVACGVPYERIEQIARDMGWFSISALPDSTLGFASNKGLGKLLKDVIGEKQFSDTHIPLSVLATDVEHGQKKVFTNGDIALAVRASAAIPIFFSPVMIEGKLYADGGLVENVPVSPLIEAGADIIIAIDLAKQGKTFKPKVIPDMIDLCVYLFAQHRDQSLKQSVAILIEPNTDSFDGHNFSQVDRLIHAGYTAAQAALPQITARIGALAPAVEVPEDTFIKRILKFIGIVT